MFLTLANFSVDIGVHFFGGKETNQRKPPQIKFKF